MANSHNRASIYFQVPFSLPSPSSLLKLPISDLSWTEGQLTVNSSTVFRKSFWSAGQRKGRNGRREGNGRGWLVTLDVREVEEGDTTCC